MTNTDKTNAELIASMVFWLFFGVLFTPFLFIGGYLFLNGFHVAGLFGLLLTVVISAVGLTGVYSLGMCFNEVGSHVNS